ncbi:PcsB-like coiled-coil domain-containing protein [Ornithinibacillus halotolerans]|uniref:3D domain-containing protein n=1 Tax=Ornithinibacillus halotolerans TaxID=1274357 RepID=A0A916S2D8_9BACI|nr:3D domain-containing protein [Ornithinibacillus halotolerans]GGA81182.1 hypothetical protein GCM10008025_25670 [Ornithinibacillus halotolerans]
MRKLTVLTLSLLFVFSAFTSIQVFAAGNNSLEDINKKREKIKNELTSAQADISTIMAEIDELDVEINRVNEEIQENIKLINETEENISATINEIEQLQEEIKELESDIEKRHEILNERLSSYQKTGGHINFLDVLFGSDSFSDFISRITMVNTITKSDADLIEDLELDIQMVEEKKTLSMTKLNDLNGMKKEQEAALALIEEQKAENEERVASLEEKQNNLISLIDQLKKEDKSLASVETEVKRKMAEAKKARELELLSNKSNKSNGKKDSDLKHVNGKTITVTSTAYTAKCKGCSGITHTGINLIENPDMKVIAVDPTVIPLGTVVHVEGYGYAIAGDTGSAIKGNKIDVFLPNKADALKWGIRRVKVTIQ